MSVEGDDHLDRDSKARLRSTGNFDDISLNGDRTPFKVSIDTRSSLKSFSF